MASESDLDELYRRPLAEFVSARNDLAKRLRLGGDGEAAKRVKKRVKPSLTAWVVNQLAFEAPDEMVALMAAGKRLREAHLSALPERQAATRARRAAISALLEKAGQILAASGFAPTRGHQQRISTTLETLSGQPSAGRAQSRDDDEAPRAGRLSRDLEPQGFDAVADLAAALGQLRTSRPTPTPRPVLKRAPRPEAKSEVAPDGPGDVASPSADGTARDELARDDVSNVEAVAESGAEQVADGSTPVEDALGDKTAAEEAARQTEASAGERRQLQAELADAREAHGALVAQAADLRSLSQRARDELAAAESATGELESALAEAERRAGEASGARWKRSGWRKWLSGKPGRCGCSASRRLRGGSESGKKPKLRRSCCDGPNRRPRTRANVWRRSKSGFRGSQVKPRDG